METTWWTQPEDLDEHQRKVVALGIDRNYLVVGPPGSGKTNLLILRGAHLYAAGRKNIAVLTFGRVLREFLASGSGNYIFPPEHIRTYVKWGAELLNMNGIEVDLRGNFPKIRRNLHEGLTVLEQQGGAENQFDAILIDEVQDYTADEIKTIRSFAKRIFAVGDSRQSIYDSTGALESLTQSVDETVELPYHYRNGLSICRVADGIRNLVDDPRGLEATANYDESKYPSTVAVSGHLTIKEQVAAAIPEISTQLRAYPDGMIGCLCPRHLELDEVWQELSASSVAGHIQLQKYSDGYDAFDGTRRVVVTSAHGAKGLEFRALHLFGMDKIARFKNVQRNLAYTAVTRAKTSLSIYHKDTLPGYLERGVVAADEEVHVEPELESLFRPRRTP